MCSFSYPRNAQRCCDLVADYRETPSCIPHQEFYNSSLRSSFPGKQLRPLYFYPQGVLINSFNHPLTDRRFHLHLAMDDISSEESTVHSLVYLRETLYQCFLRTVALSFLPGETRHLVSPSLQSDRTVSTLRPGVERARKPVPSGRKLREHKGRRLPPTSGLFTRSIRERLTRRNENDTPRESEAGRTTARSYHDAVRSHRVAPPISGMDPQGQP